MAKSQDKCHNLIHISGVAFERKHFKCRLGSNSECQKFKTWILRWNRQSSFLLQNNKNDLFFIKKSDFGKGV